MRLPEEIETVLRREVGRVVSVEPLSGGCIASASRVTSANGTFFLKWAEAPAGLTFEAEVAGLQALAEARSSLIIPGVVSARNAKRQSPGHLILEWIEPGTPGGDFSRRLGVGLAELHQNVQRHGRYGFGEDNFIGQLPQANAWREDWAEFFREMRLEPQIQRARNTGRWHSSWDSTASRLIDTLPERLPRNCSPSLCHGDLWKGNVMCATGGRPALVDPAAYFGHSETDLAMMTLFGGFDAEVFQAYHVTHTRDLGFHERGRIYQLYHMINHLNHFGGSYAAGVERLLAHF